MSEVLYYRVTGSPVLDYCSDHRREWQKIEDAWHDYATAKGGIGHVRLGECSFGGVVFARPPAPDAGWKRFRRSCRDGTHFYVPARSGVGKEPGKVLQAEFDALPKGPPAEDICDLIDFPTAVNTSHSTTRVVSMFAPVQIAWPDAEAGVYFVTLPDINSVIRRYVARGDTVITPEWAVPEGLMLSSRKRYELAIAEAEVRAEERAEAA